MRDHKPLLVAFFLLLPSLAYALPQTGKAQDLKITIQDIQSRLSDLHFQTNGQKVEVELIQEKLASLEKEISATQSELKNQNSHTQKISTLPSFESRLTQLEKTQAALCDDLKLLKLYIEKNNTVNQNRIADLEKNLVSDISTLKKSLQSMLTLLQEEDNSETYIVKAGDSLGKIAIKHKISIDALKRSNGLTSDTIVVGQKLKLPIS